MVHRLPHLYTIDCLSSWLSNDQIFREQNAVNSCAAWDIAKIQEFSILQSNYYQMYSQKLTSAQKQGVTST